MERETKWGSVIYSNDTLGVLEGEFPRNSHFYPEGKEKHITQKGRRGLEVGYREPITLGRDQNFTFQDSIVVFDGDAYTTMVDKSTVIYKEDE